MSDKSDTQSPGNSVEEGMVTDHPTIDAARAMASEDEDRDDDVLNPDETELVKDCIESYFMTTKRPSIQETYAYFLTRLAKRWLECPALILTRVPSFAEFCTVAGRSFSREDVIEARYGGTIDPLSIFQSEYSQAE